METWTRRRYAGGVRYYLRLCWVQKVKGVYLWEVGDYYYSGLSETYPSLALAKKAVEDQLVERDTVDSIKKILMAGEDDQP